MDVELKSWEIPNGFIVRGPAKTPVLVMFEDDGKVSNSGMELNVGSWLKTVMVNGTLPDNILVLVHVVEGKPEMLIKSLEVNSLLKDGERTTVYDVARKGYLKRIAYTLRQKFIKKEKAKKATEQNPVVPIGEVDSREVRRYEQTLRLCGEEDS